MSELRVLIDATPLPKNRGGVGRYVDELVRHLAALDVEVITACNKRDITHFSSLGVRAVAAPERTQSSAVRRLIWEQIGLPRLATRLGASVIHSIHYTSPLITRIPRVITIHDLTFYSHPQFHTAAKRCFFRAWLHMSTRRGRTLIAVSEATAAAYAERFPRAHSTMLVARLGGSEGQFHVPSGDEVDAFRQQLEPAPARWIAFLGTLEPRKNVPALIEGYVRAVGAMAPDAHRPALLLAGAKGWDTTIANAVERALERGLDVRLLGYVPIEHLSGLLGGAELVVYPSFGEGFGLPVVEAMATGAAVLTTRNLSLPEVGGDAVFYTGTDANDIAASIMRILDDVSGCDVMRERAVLRAATFSWDETARRTLAAYKLAAMKHSRHAPRKPGGDGERHKNRPKRPQ